ncbi:MAG: type II toxin-antitoxin system PemK/MazF family toxin [Sulfobacillus sp.]
MLPLTARHADAPWLVQIEAHATNRLEKTSAADAFQVRSVSADRFWQRKGASDQTSLTDIMAAIGIVIEIGL